MWKALKKQMIDKKHETNFNPAKSWQHIRAPAARDTARICWRSGRRLARRFIRRDQSRVPQEGRQERADGLFSAKGKNKPEQSELCSGMAPQVGLEPTTLRLTAACSTD